MNDHILIRQMAARCIIGTFPKERDIKQDVLIDLDITFDAAPAGASDDLNDTLDYKRLKDDVLAHVEGSSYRLLEALAESVAAIVLARPRATSVTLTIDKPGALTGARSVAVRITRSR